ncbi:fumarylacetoacetate hydrolase family protein [Paracoccus methylarcula]|uniref:fumarylacetoacetate hydrolase family protein n=1 Tax=Paracoccus methylarcula TaxID=72022 RepID=UPI00267AB3F2
MRDLSDHIDDIAGEVLTPEGLERLRALNPADLPVIGGEPQNGLRLGPCVGQVRKFIAIGLNYADHAAESGMAVPTEPVVFNKWTSCITGPDDEVLVPRGATKTDWEVELGVVIGARASGVGKADAMKHVAGYCVVNDVSEREWQLERTATWDKGKGFDTFGPIGPWLVTTDEIPDPGKLKMWLEVDGKRYQEGSTETMVFGVAELVSYCSTFMTLLPGDIITTGTPPGVGMGQSPQVFLKGGEVMSLGIEGLGTQTQKVGNA